MLLGSVGQEESGDKVEKIEMIKLTISEHTQNICFLRKGTKAAFTDKDRAVHQEGPRLGMRKPDL